ncbi:PAN domain protein [Ostertagia ostertagi]
MESLRASALLLAGLILGSKVHSTSGLCTRSFFAQPVIYDKAMGIDFYFTGINVPSVSACADFCGARKFCRTAIFNSYTKTCAISYEYTLNCRYNKNRYTDFDLRSSSSHLIQVACVAKCSEDYAPLMPLRRQPQVVAENSSNGSARQKVELITGDPHDGSKRERFLPEEQTRAIETTTTKGQQAITTNVNNSALPAVDEVKKQATRRGPSQVCFRTIERRYLLGGSFEQHTTSSIDECRCLCADTFSALRLHRCQSLQWYPSGKCVLNKGSHLGRYDLIEDRNAIYQYINCDIQVLLDIASRVCKAANTSNTVTGTSARARTTSTTEKPSYKRPVNREQSTEVPTATWKFLTTPSATSPSTTTASTEQTSTEESTSTELTTTTVEITESPTPEPTEVSRVTETTTTTTEAIEEVQTTEGREVESSTSVVPQETNQRNATELSPLKIVNSGCFEEIRGYMMTNVAGGLEHDVSMDECKCFCANSKTSRRYSFECLSATYYHEERDCILNLDNRHRNPQLLEQQSSDYSVTYLGMTCGKEETSASLTKASFTANCQRVTPTTTTTPAPKKRKMGVNSDKCFLELSDFVLEGTALAIETMISHQECKCRCLNGEERYGEACQSFQYYFDSSTCLINKQNRFSNSENFNFVPSSQKRSYFEHRCATRDDVRLKYLDDFCSGDSVEAQNNTADTGSKSKKSQQETEKSQRGPDSMHEVGTKETTTTPSLKSKDTDNEKIDQPNASKEVVSIFQHSGSDIFRHEKKPGKVVMVLPMIPMVYNRTEPPPPKWNSDNRTSGGYGGYHKVEPKVEKHFMIPEAESEEDGNAPRTQPTTVATTTTTERPKIKRYVVVSFY